MGERTTENVLSTFRKAIGGQVMRCTDAHCSSFSNTWWPQCCPTPACMCLQSTWLILQIGGIESVQWENKDTRNRWVIDHRKSQWHAWAERRRNGEVMRAVTTAWDTVNKMWDVPVVYFTCDEVIAQTLKSQVHKQKFHLEEKKSELSPPFCYVNFNFHAEATWQLWQR